MCSVDVEWSSSTPPLVVKPFMTAESLRRHVRGCDTACRRRRWGMGSLRLRVIVVLLASGLMLTLAPAVAVTATLPDDRAYELVSSLGEDESVLNGATPWFGAATNSGETVDWQALGACCGASSAGLNSFRSQRTSSGWETRSFTPVANEPLTGLDALQEALLWSTELRQTIFMTSASLVPGDQRPKGSDGDDLYLQGPTGALEWLTQGPVGSGRGPDPTSFEAATPDAQSVVFGSAEQLTANATGLSSRKGAEYLYVRNAQSETTSLIDVNNDDELIGTDGASIADAGPPVERPFAFYVPGQYRGSTTHAISESGSKVFFETPPAGQEGPPEYREPHLYMRDLANDTTTPLDNPEAAGSAHYQGASADGSLVFFTSDEGLAGTPKVNELYEYNTTTTAIGLAPPMTAVPVASGAGIIGVTAISNDGSHVFFVASEVLATNSNSTGQTATVSQPNLYVYNADTGQTQFATTLALPDVSNCKPTCASPQPNELVATADVLRPAYTTPDGAVLVFASSNDLTGQDHTPTTVLSLDAGNGEHTLTVTSTAGFLQNHTITIGVGEQEQLATIEKVDGPTQLTLREFEPGVNLHAVGTPVTELNSEVYRFSLSGDSLVCLSCTPDGVLETASASLGEVPGGSYASGSGHIAQMSEDGSAIFFDSPDPLLPAMAGAETNRMFEPSSIYEWENGKLSVIADASNGGAVFDGTTPSANDVFFSTRSALTPTAGTGYEHIYDARANGGFPELPPLTQACAEEACRPLAAPAPNVLPPASAVFGELNESLAPTPSFSVARITALQRSQVARNGRLVLTISATAPGEIAVSAYARIRGKAVNVAHASGTLRQAGRMTLTLHLSRSARTQIAEGQIHVLQLHVDYRTTGAVEVLQLVLNPAHKEHREA
jgi:hypothetical protein